MVVSKELSCGEVGVAPKLVHFLFLFFLFHFHFHFHGKEKKFCWNFDSGKIKGKQICFCFRDLAKKLAQDAMFSVTEKEMKFVSVFVRGLQLLCTGPKSKFGLKLCIRRSSRFSQLGIEEFKNL